MSRIERVMARLDELGMKESELANALEETQQTVNNWKRRDLPKARVLEVARALGMRPEFLEYGEGEALTHIPAQGGTSEPLATYGDEVEIPLYNARGAAGDGAMNHGSMMIGSLTFKRRSLEKRGLNPNNLATIYVDGDSMSPGICDGDVVIFDRSKTTIRHGEIYVLRFCDELLVKRLHKLIDGALKLVSDNTLDPKYSPRTIPASHMEEVEILGQVVWGGGWF